MRDDPEKLNPLQGLGHFVCVDGFGPVSKEERAAGLSGHGEAHRIPWEILSAEKKDAVAFRATLPIVQETFRRTNHMVDGDSVIYGPSATDYPSSDVPSNRRTKPASSGSCRVANRAGTRTALTRNSRRFTMRRTLP